MRLRLLGVLVLAGAIAHGEAARADVTVSQSNSPALGLSEQMASLIGAEKQALRKITPKRLSALAEGPRKRLPRLSIPAEVLHSHAFLATQPAPAGDAEWQCLRSALYFESRGETLKGQFAVAEVILNRVESPAYPDSVCAVVEQAGSGSCQFSYICDGRSDRMHDPVAADLAGRIARVMLDGAPRTLTDGATHFHTRAVRPGWATRFPRTAAIGAHLFYRQP